VGLFFAKRRKDRDFVFGDGPRSEGGKHRGFSDWSKSKTQCLLVLRPIFNGLVSELDECHFARDPMWPKSR
jgi:hypothetical protein